MNGPSAIERVEVGDRAAYGYDRPTYGAHLDESHGRDPGCNGSDADGCTATCPECDRVFDLTDGEDAEEWAYGHDCEAES